MAVASPPSEVIFPARRKNAFTLIEMLVVICIISILASMLSGSLMKARDAAVKISCANNMKQMGMLCFQYANQYYDYTPGIMYARSPQYIATGSTWLAHLWAQYEPETPWINRTNAIFRCAGNNMHPSDKMFSMGVQATEEYTTCSYSINGWFGEPVEKNNGAGYLCVKTARIAKPSKLLAFREGIWFQYLCYKFPNDTYIPDYSIDTAARNNGSTNYSRHDFGTNLLHADGHVKWNAGLLSRNDRWMWQWDGKSISPIDR